MKTKEGKGIFGEKHRENERRRTEKYKSKNKGFNEFKFDTWIKCHCENNPHGANENKMNLKLLYIVQWYKRSIENHYHKWSAKHKVKALQSTMNMYGGRSEMAKKTGL